MVDGRDQMRLYKAYLANVFYLLTDLKGQIRPTLCHHATSSLIHLYIAIL
jgi:hypothetical protein